jgi:hypothetical protein
MVDTRAGGGSGQKTTLQLPEAVLALDLAVHPTEGWAAVSAVVWSGNDNPERAFVSVLNPQTRTWTPAHQVDIGPAALGRYTRTVEVAITGDGVVHAVWGMSDPDFGDNDPPARVWAAESRDFGASWSAPVVVGEDCRRVNDLAATLSGWLVAPLVCNAGPEQLEPAVATRSPAGAWSLERLPGAVWYFSEGATAIIDDGEGERATIAFLSGPNGQVVAPPRMLMYTRHLDAAEAWQPSTLDIDVPGLAEGARTRGAQALVYRPTGATADRITITIVDADGSAVYAIHSSDGGRSWLAPELVGAPQAGGEQFAFAAPAFDAVTNRLIALHTCCREGGWGNATAATHFARWSVPGSGMWADPTPGERVPLVLGSRAAGETVVAQARNAPTTWVAWVEGGNAVEVRSFALGTLLPRAGR